MIVRSAMSANLSFLLLLLDVLITRSLSCFLYFGTGKCGRTKMVKSIVPKRIRALYSPRSESARA